MLMFARFRFLPCVQDRPRSQLSGGETVVVVVVLVLASALTAAGMPAWGAVLLLGESAAVAVQLVRGLRAGDCAGDPAAAVVRAGGRVGLHWGRR
jgi:hypothetical protein